ncbi:hypothetical protein WJX77_009989 [Trebouxia sp. C0004]
MFEPYCAPTTLPPSFSSGRERSAVPRRPSSSQGVHVEHGETAVQQPKEGTEAAMLLALLHTHNPTAQGSEPNLQPLAGNVHDQSWPCQLSALPAPSLEVPQGQTCPAAIGLQQLPQHHSQLGSISSMLTGGESPLCLPLHSTHVELAALPPLKGQAWEPSISNPASLATTVCTLEAAYTTAMPPPLATALDTSRTAAASDISPPLATAFYMTGDSAAGPEGVSAVPMADMLLPLCHSSMSADSRQSCSPGPGCKHNRHEQVADDDMDEEAKVTSRRARNREAARRTRAKRMDTIASLSNEVQLLASMNQGLSVQLQRAVYQVDAMGQENALLRRILIAHAQEMTEAENVSDNICTLAGDLLQLLTQGKLVGKQPDIDASRR